MAATIRLVTFSGQTVTPKNDAIVYDASVGRCGVFYGCDVTASGNTIYVSSGYGMIRGRFFEIEASTLSVTLASTDTLSGRLYVRLDLSNLDSPIQLLTYTDSSLPALEQDADANYIDGVWEMELATFSVTTTEVTGLTETYETITDNGTLIDTLRSAVSGVSFYGPTNVSSTSPTPFIIPNNYRGLFAVMDSNQANNGFYMLYCTGSGGVNTKAVSTASNITINTSTANRLTLTPASGSRVVIFINASGRVTV